MKEPFFSIIIPTLNEEKYLPRLLTDLTQQKISDFETIVVDGGSQDQTVALAEKQASKLHLTILTSPKKSASFQRNLGGKSAAGEYVVFFDADVQIPPTFLSSLKSTLNKKRLPFVTTYVRADSRRMSDQVLAVGYNLAYELSILVERNIAPGFNFIVKRDLFLQTGGFRDDVVHAEDLEYALRLQRLGYPMVVLKKPKLTFSLRRYRRIGHLNVVRKHVVAGIHVFSKGPITKDIFSYPMGGAWYKQAQTEVQKAEGFKKMQQYVQRFTKLLFE